MMRVQIKSCFVKVLVILVGIVFLLVGGCASATVGKVSYSPANTEKSTNKGNDDQDFVDKMFALFDPVESLFDAVESVLVGGRDTRHSGLGNYRHRREKAHLYAPYPRSWRTPHQSEASYPFGRYSLPWGGGGISMKGIKIDMPKINVNGLGGQ